jgi:uncharacterized protein
MSEASALPAGSLASWTRAMTEALGTHGTSDVPCGTCTACCTSSQFVHIGPDEVETLARIPDALRFPAPGLPAGHVVLGYDTRGHCPMLVDGACSIYAQRPRTCRTYDCRVFAAAAVQPDKPAIAEQVRRWRFDVSHPSDDIRRDAIREAASFLTVNAATVFEGSRPTRTQLAVLAVALHHLFLRSGTDGPLTRSVPELSDVQDELQRLRTT